MNLAIKMFLAEYDNCPFRNEYEKINWACKEVGISEFIAELRSLQLDATVSKMESVHSVSDFHIVETPLQNVKETYDKYIDSYIGMQEQGNNDPNYAALALTFQGVFHEIVKRTTNNTTEYISEVPKMTTKRGLLLCFDDWLVTLKDGGDWLTEDEAKEEYEKYCHRSQYNETTSAENEQVNSNVQNVPKATKVTRFELIDHTPSGTGRDFVKYGIRRLELSYQDEGRTLKIFIK